MKIDDLCSLIFLDQKKISYFETPGTGKTHLAVSIGIEAAKKRNLVYPLTITAFKVVAYGDSLDWRDYGVKSIVNTVVDHEHLGNGSIILCHNGAKYTKDALESMITGLKEKGYEIVPISQLIYTDEYYMDHEGRQFEK